MQGRRSGRSRPGAAGDSILLGAMCLSGAALATGLAQCTYGNGVDDGPVVRDSAGIEILENGGRGKWKPIDRLRVTGQPVVEIGDVESEEFAFERVADALLLDDSLFIVANQGSGEMIFFNFNGDWLYSVGRIGSGPGEFDRLKAIEILPDGCLVAFDSGHRRVSVFEIDGELVRTLPLEAGLERGVGTMGIGWLDRGTFVARILESVGETATAEVGQWRLMDSRAELVFFDEHGLPFGMPIRTLGDQRLSMLTAQVGSEYHIMGLPNPFLRSFVADAKGSRVAFGETSHDEIHVLDANGNSVRIIRRERPGRRLTAGIKDEWIDFMVAGIRNEDTRRRRQYERMPFPSVLPAFRSLVLDEDGERLWVEEFELGAIMRKGASRWSVYAEDGHLLGEVEMPRGFQPMRIGSEYVLAGRG